MQNTDVTSDVQPSGEDYIIRDDSHIIDSLLDLYCEERTRFFASKAGRFFMPKEKGEKPLFLTRRHLAFHIYHRWAISTIGSLEGSKWTTFDVDSGGWDMAKQVIDALWQIGIPYDKIYISTSGGKGYHVEIFYDQLIYYSLQKRMYREVLRLTGASEHQVELRPTATQSIKIPLSRHYKTNKICWYLDRVTGKPIESKEYIATIEKLPAVEVRELIWALPAEENEEEVSAGEGIREDAELDEALATLDVTKLPVIEEAGTRHATVMRIAIGMLNKGFSHDDTLRTLLQWWDIQNIDNSTTYYDEAVDDIHSIVNWVYEKLKKVGGVYRSKYIVTRWDVERVLEQKGVAKRAVFFNILAWSKAKGYARTSEQLISRQIDISASGVHYAIQGLQEKDQIKVQAGKRHYDSTGCWQERSTMWTRQGISSLEIPEDKVLASLTEISIRDVAHDFWKVYFDTLFAIADRDWAMKKLCKREKDILAKLEYERKNQDGTQD